MSNTPIYNKADMYNDIPNRFWVKELLFRGFKPCKNLTTIKNVDYGYFATNRIILGNYYFYDKKYPEINNKFHQDFANIAFGNLIRTIYPKYN